MHFYNIEIKCLDISESKKFYSGMFNFLNSKKIKLEYSDDIIKFDSGDYANTVVFWGNAQGIPSIRLKEIDSVKTIIAPENRTGLVQFSINIGSASLVDDLYTYFMTFLTVDGPTYSESIKGLYSFTVQDPDGANIEFLSLS